MESKIARLDAIARARSVLSGLVFAIACSTSAKSTNYDAGVQKHVEDSGTHSVDSGVRARDSGTSARAGSGASGSGGRGTGGARAMDAAIDGGAKELPRDPCVAAGNCPPGTWINVTPKEMDPSVLRPTQNIFGPGSIVRDPARPSDLYVGGSKAGLWGSTDYGNTWTLVNDTLPDVPRGVTIAVAGTTPATIWAAAYNSIYKSTDAGKTFTQTNLSVSLYSLQVDPYDNTHLISGLHEADGVMESTDGGASWHSAMGSGWPSGGVSFYPYFLDTGDAASTRSKWFAIAQNGATPVVTSDGGAHWSAAKGVDGLQHPHGNSQLFQSGSTLFVAGVSGPGQGVYRSTDLGASWSRVDSGNKPEAVVWGTTKNVYAMYAWACSNCDLDTAFEQAILPGDTWSAADVPSTLKIGPNSVAVTSDGHHAIAVAVMWDQGIWRYVEE